MPAALALSPHLDDAAFSCGGTLARLVEAGWDVTMVTVFTGSVADPKGFALACQTDKGLGPDIDYMALRRDEDMAAARALGVRVRHLPFREAPHRGYASAPELFADIRPDDTVVPDLTQAFRGLIAEIEPSLVLAPQAVGGHVDHVQVVSALNALDVSAPILWWRDFPYTVRSATPKEPLGRLFAQWPMAEVRCGDAARVAKAQACAAYASQLGFQFGGVTALRARLAEEDGIERFRRSGPTDEALDGFLARAGTA